jgi:hypothetical protein
MRKKRKPVKGKRRIVRDELLHEVNVVFISSGTKNEPTQVGSQRATNSKVFSNLAHSSCGGQSISWDFVIGKLICNNLRSKVDVHANCWVPHRSAAGPLMFHTYVGVCYSTKNISFYMYCSYNILSCNLQRFFLLY